LIRDPRDEEETDSFFQTLKKDLDLRIDLGAQYNDNVSMLPSSREDVFGSPASAQGTASISARYIAWTNDTFRFGPTLDVDYTLNEGNFDNLNLQSYRGGAFADAVFEFDDIKVKPRVAYSYTHDLFGGNTFGRRHTLATSVGFVWTPSQITTAYWSIDNNGIISNRPFPRSRRKTGLPIRSACCTTGFAGSRSCERCGWERISRTPIPRGATSGSTARRFMPKLSTSSFPSCT
jgi:hypothetical protein